MGSILIACQGKGPIKHQREGRIWNWVGIITYNGLMCTWTSQLCQR